MAVILSLNTVMTHTLDDLSAAVLAFRDERDWARFHSLKHLIVSISLEASEVLELTQWKSDAEVEALPEDSTARDALADELADVFAYLLLAADKAGIDLSEALQQKLLKNAKKYPVEKSFGRREKYSRL